MYVGDQLFSKGVNIVNLHGSSETGVSLTLSIGIDDAYYNPYAHDYA